MYIDTHCHLFEEYYDNIDEVIKKIKNNKIIVCGVNTQTNKEVIKLCNKYKNVYGTIGIHPEFIDDVQEQDLNFIEKKLNNSKIIGIGEIGLDYYYKSDNKEQQIYWLKKQIDLAYKYKKPIIIHSRDSLEDIKKIMINYKKKDHKAVLHCYTYDEVNAKELIEYNIMIGVGGIITFKNSENVKKVIENIDISYILLETDSPYLTPVPFRSKKNDPSYIPYIADKIAEIKGMTSKEVVNVTSNNAMRQFDFK